MKILHSTKAYNVAIKAATGTIYQNEEGKFVKDDKKIKSWFTGKNKKGRAAIKDMAIILEQEFLNEDGKFVMPTFTKVIVHEEEEYCELVTSSGNLEDTVILKKD